MSMIPAEPGWRAIHINSAKWAESTGAPGWAGVPVVAWAIVEQATVDNYGEVVDGPPASDRPRELSAVVCDSDGPEFVVDWGPTLLRIVAPGGPDPTPEEVERAQQRLEDHCRRRVAQALQAS